MLVLQKPYGRLREIRPGDAGTRGENDPDLDQLERAYAASCRSCDAASAVFTTLVAERVQAQQLGIPYDRRSLDPARHAFMHATQAREDATRALVHYILRDDPTYASPDSLRAQLRAQLEALAMAAGDYYRADIEVQELGVIRPDDDPELAPYIRQRNAAQKAMHEAIRTIKALLEQAMRSGRAD